MAPQTVEFRYHTGLKRSIFRNPVLRGSWDTLGRYAELWLVDTPMEEIVGEDGCPTFRATVALDLADHPRIFRWGVSLDGPQGSHLWGIPTEVHSATSTERYREFRLTGAPDQVERYYLTHGRRLGANKRVTAAGLEAGLHFGIWAPNAQRVDVVFGDAALGYIADDGTGIDPTQPVIALAGPSADGIWEGMAGGSFDAFKSRPYMYRLVNAQGETVFRSDIFSRHQIGKGTIDPARGTWPGTPDTLDGTVSCSVVIDPDVVRRAFLPPPPGTPADMIPAEEFWASEHTPGLPVPTEVEDLVIYELHVGSLGFGKAGPGNLLDALGFLDHLVDLGVNAVELLPMAEFSGNAAWGYGDTHHFCIESSAGGRDQYRHFVRECHRRGIAVIQDVVYNHYDFRATRAQWQYDSTAPEDNIYYWYEGRAADYADATLGYLRNGSSGATPRFWEEVVRHQFVSSAAFLIEEMHVDGLRVDLTQAIHRDNALEADGRSIGAANAFGQKLLREWSRTLHMIRPSAMLIAEDHTGWDAVTKVPAQGGLGFDATWDAAFYHSLIGDSDMAGGRPRVLKNAGFGGNDPLGMDALSGALYASQYDRVVFHESHDEAGNAPGTARTMAVAVNEWPLVGATRTWAEARARVCAGLSLLSAGTPMFFMGEEVGAHKRYTYESFLAGREDILGERAGNGAAMFRFYQDLITLTRRVRAIRSQNIDILHQSNANRIIAFKRWLDNDETIVVASFSNTAFADGYAIEKDLTGIPDAGWKELFNSDSASYGGQNVGNLGAVVGSRGGRLTVVVPAAGFVVFARQ
jgi:1,4-alpha-glucan branching enzyme